MKTCSNCKKINENDADYCKYCGKALASQKYVEPSLAGLNNKSTGDEILASLKLQISNQLSENRRMDLELLEKIGQMSSRFDGLLMGVTIHERELWDVINKVEKSVLSLQGAQSALLIFYATILQASYQNLNYSNYKYAVDKLMTDIGPQLKELNVNATHMTLSALEMLRIKYLSIFDK